MATLEQLLQKDKNAYLAQLEETREYYESQMSGLTMRRWHNKEITRAKQIYDINTKWKQKIVDSIKVLNNEEILEASVNDYINDSAYNPTKQEDFAYRVIKLELRARLINAGFLKDEKA